MTRTRQKPTTPASPAITKIPKQDAPARLAALPNLPIAELKAEWRRLVGTEPPYNQRFLESRLAYRTQELAYGGLKREMLERLEALGEQLDGRNVTLRRIRRDQRPIAGTRLLREYQGFELVVTVSLDAVDILDVQRLRAVRNEGIEGEPPAGGKCSSPENRYPPRVRR